jgi:hypothetical protein
MGAGRAIFGPTDVQDSLSKINLMSVRSPRRAKKRLVVTPITASGIRSGYWDCAGAVV